MLSILGIIVFALIMAMALFSVLAPAILVILAAWFVGSMIDAHTVRAAMRPSDKDGSQ